MQNYMYLYVSNKYISNVTMGIPYIYIYIYIEPVKGTLLPALIHSVSAIISPFSLPLLLYLFPLPEDSFLILPKMLCLKFRITHHHCFFHNEQSDHSCFLGAFLCHVLVCRLMLKLNGQSLFVYSCSHPSVHIT